MGNKKAVVAGHVCVDITPVFARTKVERIDKVLAPGKLVETKAAEISLGGAVSNTGLAMKILGADVSLKGKVGKDAFGEMVLSMMKNYDAESGMIVDENATSSYTIAIAPPGHDRTFLHHPGANDCFYCSDIDFASIKDAQIFHFGYPQLLKSMYENGSGEMIKILKSAQNYHMATSLDMVYADAESAAGKVNWRSYIEEVIPYVDFFVPSVEELCYYMEPKRYEEWLQRADGGDVTMVLSIEKDVKPLADQLMEMGAKVVLIKCGAPGIYYRTAGKEVLAKIGSNLDYDFTDWADREGFEESYVPDAVLSGTGAGDTSIAAFLTAILYGYPLEKCLQLSVATGASCVAAYDSLSGLKPLKELEERIANGWEKQHLL